MSRQGIGMTSQRTRERLIQRLMDQGITRFEVLEAIRSVPRHLFVDEALAHRSYEDTALPIGYGRTLSQPYVVAKMSELALAHGRPKKVLELGSGSGYQTAILASLVDAICAIERIKPLMERARQQLRVVRSPLLEPLLLLTLELVVNPRLLRGVGLGGGRGRNGRDAPLAVRVGGERLGGIDDIVDGPARSIFWASQDILREVADSQRLGPRATPRLYLGSRVG